MNLYILVEGRRTEKKIYPKWLEFLFPELVRVESPKDLRENNYFIISGKGYPRLLTTTLLNSLKDVRENGKLDFFLIILDSDEEDAETRREKVQEALKNQNIDLPDTKIRVIIQHRCVETWLLGNRKFFKNNPNEKRLCEFIRHYNVSIDDPESMPPFEEYTTQARFHADYLGLMFSERKQRYTKNHPGHAAEPIYFNQIIERAEANQDHLRSFQEFLKICDEMKESSR